MASIDSGGGGGGGKKSVDQEIPLIPFIDLLFCCVMFLLATAVWNQLAQLEANQAVPGQAAENDEQEEPEVKLVLQVQSNGYTLASTAGDSHQIPMGESGYDASALREKLQERRRLEPNREKIVIAPDDDVVYEEIIRAMDIAMGEDFTKLTVGDGGALL